MDGSGKCFLTSTEHLFYLFDTDFVCIVSNNICLLYKLCCMVWIALNVLLYVEHRVTDVVSMSLLGRCQSLWREWRYQTIRTKMCSECLWSCMCSVLDSRCPSACNRRCGTWGVSVLTRSATVCTPRLRFFACDVTNGWVYPMFMTSCLKNSD